MEKKTRLERFKEDVDKANALPFCEHSDGVFVTLVITFVVSLLAILIINGGIDQSMVYAFGFCGLIFFALGAGFWFNRYTMWRRMRAVRIYNEEKQRLIQKGQQQQQGEE